MRIYATDTQARIVDAILECGSASKAAKKLGIDRRNVDRALKRLEKSAAKQGYAPDHNMVQTVPDGYHVKGVSTLYDADGGVKAQWVKSSESAEQRADLYREAIEAMCASIPKEKATKAPKLCDQDLLSLYVLSDYHLGMLSWEEESGGSWDMKIAEQMLVDWFMESARWTEKSKVAVVAQLGDFLHFDGLEAITPAHGNVLDASARFQQVVRVAIRAFRRIIRELLKRHEQVHLIHAEGNHDPASSVWLREMFAALYEDEPRVTVELSPDPYYAYQWGETALFFHHGHKRKPQNIDDVFVAKFRELFGKTKFAYAHMGHYHSDRVLESNLMKIRQHRTIASPDAYASRGGWMSGRSADVLLYHRDFGEIGRFTVPTEVLS
jgi:hypothetical protein